MAIDLLVRLYSCGNAFMPFSDDPGNVPYVTPELASDLAHRENEKAVAQRKSPFDSNRGFVPDLAAGSMRRSAVTYVAPGSGQVDDLSCSSYGESPSCAHGPPA